MRGTPKICHTRYVFPFAFMILYFFFFHLQDLCDALIERSTSLLFKTPFTHVYFGTIKNRVLKFFSLPLTRKIFILIYNRKNGVSWCR